MIANPSDPATKTGYFWMERFARYAAAKGQRVIFQKTPTLDALYQALQTYNPQLVVANGHGGSKSLRVGEAILIGTAGYDSAINYRLKNGDEAWFAGRITLLLTCNAGQELVKALVQNGAVAAMGYKEPFIFESDEDVPQDQDTAAKPFFEALLQPAIQLADGATFQEAIKATREAYLYYIKQFALTTDRDLLSYLKFDLENLVAMGDPSAKLS